MSISRRLQYVFIEVKRSDTQPCVTLSGPTEVLNSVSEAGFNVENDDVVCSSTYVGGSMQIRVTAGFDMVADNSTTLFKAGLLEEVLKCGFKPVSNVTDDFLALSREVDKDYF
jgi:hypothetical protein